MILYSDNQVYLSRFIKESFGEEQTNAKRAADYAGIFEKDYFEELKKQYANIETEIDIEKRSWEK